MYRKMNILAPRGMQPQPLTKRPEPVSVVDEKVDGTVDGLKKVVEADEDSERLRQTKQRRNFVKHMGDKKAQSYKSLRTV